MRRRDVHPRRLVTFSSSLPFGQSTKLWGVALLVCVCFFLTQKPSLLDASIRRPKCASRDNTSRVGALVWDDR